MNIEKITEGQVFPTFRKLLMELGENPCKGNKLEALKKEVARYLDYEKIYNNSNAIVITKIYDHPLPKVDGRSNKEFELQNEFEIILSHFFRENHTHKGNRVWLYYNLYCFSAKVFNILYPKDTNQAFQAPVDEKNQFAINVFSYILFDICRQKVYLRLKKMSDKNLIDFYPAYITKDDLYIEDTSEFNQIKEIENKVATDLGYSNPVAAQNSKKSQQYFNKREQVISEEMNLHNVRNVVVLNNISFEKDYNEEELKKAIETWNRYIYDKLSKRLNSKRSNLDQKINNEYKDWFSNLPQKNKEEIESGLIDEKYLYDYIVKQLKYENYYINGNTFEAINDLFKDCLLNNIT